jgi:transcriptional regulator with XRE-family HTH domain
MGKRVPARFDTTALYVAMDAHRQERGLTWRQVAREVGGPSPSTILNTKKGGIMEADGVISMLDWLGLPAEAFLRGAPAQSPHLAGQSDNRNGRVDTPALYGALDAARLAGGFTWREVLDELGPDCRGPAAITKLAKGSRADIHGLTAITQWLGVPVEAFVRRRGQPDYGPVLRGRDFPGADRNPLRQGKPRTE